MAKRPPAHKPEIDIFDDERLTQAMAGATAPVEELQAENNKQGEQEATPAKVLQHPAAKQSREGPQTPSDARTQVLSEETPIQTPIPSKPVKGENGAPRMLERNVPLKTLVPPGMRIDFGSLMAELSAALGGVKLDDSNVMRPIIERFILKHDYLVEAFKAHAGELKRPRNGDMLAMLEFDEAIGELIDEAEGLYRKRSHKKGRSA